MRSGIHNANHPEIIMPWLSSASPGVAARHRTFTYLSYGSRLAILLVSMCMVFSACINIGPRAIQAGRNDYNIAIQQTNDQQLLLNLVRLRYRDNPLFLEVSSIATQFVFSGGIAGGATIQAGPDQGTVGGNLGYSEEPTVSYTPLQGEEFVQRFLSPITLDTILLLYHSGWSIERVLRVAVQNLNGLNNAASASGPTPARAPEFKQFRRATKLLRKLQIDGLLDLGYEAHEEQKVPIIRIATADPISVEADELRNLMGLTSAETHYTLVERATGRDARVVGIGARSLMGILFYLSHAVDVPEKDEVAGRVTQTYDRDGHPFDWLQVSDGLFRISAGAIRPENAAVAVQYRDSWFYIDDSDLESKSTFALLSQLFSLQSGKSGSMAPVLTIPVGR